MTEKESRTIQLYGKNGKMIYSIDVQENKETSDIQVDAGNGKVLNNQPGSSVEIGEDLIEEYMRKLFQTATSILYTDPDLSNLVFSIVYLQSNI